MGRIRTRICNLVGRTRRIRRAFLAATRQHDGPQQQHDISAALTPVPPAIEPASRATLTGAVPPKLVRDATDACTVRTRIHPRNTRFDTLHLAERQSCQIDTLRFGRGDQPAGDVVRIAERQLSARAPASRRGRSLWRNPSRRIPASAPGPASCRAPCRRSPPATGPRPRRIEYRLLVLLHVLGIRPAAAPSSPSTVATSAPVTLSRLCFAQVRLHPGYVSAA